MRPTADALYRSAVARLRAAGVENAPLDARVLLAHVLDVDTAQLVSASDEVVPPEARARFDEAIARRAAREPVAHIVGVKEFWSRPFTVSRDVLVPRPETETLVEAALQAKPKRDAALRVLDLGVGSGALLAALLIERPNGAGVGVDRSVRALAIARFNLDALGVGTRAHLACADWGSSLSGPFDIVVANPPYIASRDVGSLPPEVRDHDPGAALDGGDDGLSAYRAILSDIGRLLTPNGVAVLELGDGQEEAVAELARQAHILVNGSAIRDLAGRPRALVLGSGGDKKRLGNGPEPH